MIFIKTPSIVDLYSVNPMLIGGSTDTDLSTENLRCDCVVLDGATLSELFRLSNFFDDNGEVYFNISKLIDLGFDIPDRTTISTFMTDQATDGVVKYKIKLEEYYGADLSAPQDEANSEFFYAMKGGIDPIRFRNYDFYDDYLSNRWFLTHQPRTKLVHKEHPEWLYIPTLKYYASGVENGLILTIYFDDGTETTLDYPNSSYNSLRGDKHFVPVGYTQLALETYEVVDKTIIKWKVEFKHTESFIVPPDPPVKDTLTEDFIFELDFSNQSWDVRYFLFENSLGGMDVVATRGKAKEKANFSRQISSHAEGLTPTLHQHRENNFNVQSQEETSVNIGWLDLDQRIWLQDLFLSGNVWEIDIPNQLFIPVRLTSSNFQISEDDNPLQSVSFSFVYSTKKGL